MRILTTIIALCTAIIAAVQVAPYIEMFLSARREWNATWGEYHKEWQAKREAEAYRGAFVWQDDCMISKATGILLCFGKSEAAAFKARLARECPQRNGLYWCDGVIAKGDKEAR